MSIKRSPGRFGNAAHSFGALTLLASIAVAWVPSPAMAQQQGGSATGMALPSGGWYGGLSTGRSQLGIRDGILPVTGAKLSNLSGDESSTGYKLYGGYQFSRNIALEGGYADFSRLDKRRDLTETLLGSAPASVRAGGFYLGAIGVVPLADRFSLFGKLGTGYSTSSASLLTGGAFLPGPAELGPRRSEWNSKYGLGASYEMSHKLGLRFEYERINSLGDSRPGDGNVGMWSLGLTKRY
ncbi:MAG: outer membrane beta-barrel protein [Proteobacteria bacterium]|nr:outer membrane beta-barrel protein [Pseudomonadota bacterium]